MAEQHTHTTQGSGSDALAEILQGCSTCCDGTLREAQRVNAPESAVRKIEQARDLCREAADEVDRSLQR